MKELTFFEWYERLQSLAEPHGVNVSDEDAWREAWDEGQTPEESFYCEYPEYKGLS